MIWLASGIAGVTILSTILLAILPPTDYRRPLW